MSAEAAAQLTAQLDALDDPGALKGLYGLRRGIEKESLRVTPDGLLSLAPHPAAFGSPLTHPHITTDFAEAQLELITDVFESVNGCLHQLDEIHRFVYAGLPDEELLWATSMPCVLQDDDIPVGRYGSSNIAKAKTVYRLGLGYRYGRLMQTISGIHYNFSLPEAFWPWYAARQGWDGSEQDLRTAAYFALIRNFRRLSWLLLYLFGASPAVCKSFLQGRSHSLETFDEGSLYAPYGTTLRMGRLGYQSDAQSRLHVSYNCLDSYARTLSQALTNPYPPYERIGTRREGEWIQLSTSLLQIENEFYGTIRPKRGTYPEERPLPALVQRGVEYVEVRCMDVDPFMPLGIDAESMRFLDTFLLYCLLCESPPDSPEESAAMDRNQRRVVEEGRRPGLQLEDGERSRELSEWATALLDGCEQVAERLDAAHGGGAYAEAVARKRPLVRDPERTPSARILARMRTADEPFFRFAMARSIEHAETLQARPLPPERLAHYQRLSQESVAEQVRIEAEEDEDFETFLTRFHAQARLDRAEDAAAG